MTRLPAGRHGLPPDLISANQRDRLIDAFARVVVEKGYRATTVHDITSLASVSRNVFYEQFGGKDECFIAAYEVIRAHVGGVMEEAAAPFADGPERLLAALLALLRYLAAEPDLGRLCLIEPLTAGPAMASHHEAALESLVARLRKIAAKGDGSEKTDEVLILGAIALVSRRINLGEAETLEGLLPELGHILLSERYSQNEIAAMVKGAQERGAPPRASV